MNDKIIDITRIIDHLNDCQRDLANGIDVDKNVIIGAAYDEVKEWAKLMKEKDHFIKQKEIIASFKTEWKECNDQYEDELITEYDLKQQKDALESTCILMDIEWEEIASK